MRHSGAATPLQEHERALDLGVYGESAQAGDATRGLMVDGVSVMFGGNVALQNVSLRVPAGAITGLIGPNGAGKSTLVNVCSGLIPATRGHVRLDGVDVSGASPSARARRGLGRTFQRVELWPSLSVRENVALGLEASLAGRNILRHLVPARGNSRVVTDAADTALEQTGLTGIATREARHLSLGQRRLTELARCLAARARIVMLDEPASGLDVMNVNLFAEILRRVTEERGLATLLIDHDVPLVMDLCEYVYVLDAGELIFEGPARAVGESPAVKAAYIGLAAEDSSLSGKEGLS